MTICIAGIVENSKLIAITDKMLTLSSPVATKYEVTENNKAIQLSSKSVALFAGDVLTANQILARALKKTKKELDDIHEVAKLVQESYLEQWKEEIQQNVFSRFNLTHELFIANQLNLSQELVNGINKILGESNLAVEIIVAGFDLDNKPHLYLVSSPGTLTAHDSLGYITTGSGSQHARLSLIESQYHSATPLNKGLHDLYVAKKKAEYDPGVGSLHDIIVIESKYRKFTKEENVGIENSYKDYYNNIKRSEKIFISNIASLINQDD